jgi:DNA-binding HxlR family transcriptional regulator
MDDLTKQQRIMVVNDVVEIIGGRWRSQILAYLCQSPCRFNELKTTLKTITSSTLTKELRYLEDIKMIERKIIQEAPVVIEYKLTTHGKSIKDLIDTIIEWGLKHRATVFDNKQSSLLN